MKTFSLLLLRILSMRWAAAQSTSLRGPAQEGNPNPHRHLLEETTCTLLRKNTQYGPTEEHPNGFQEESWACELSDEDTARLKVHFVDIVEASTVEMIANSTSGESTLTMSEAVIDTEKPRMYIPKDARVQVSNDKGKRHLEKATGSYETLVIRVSDQNGVGPDASVADLEEKIFGSDHSLKSQMETCSYGKLEIEPTRGSTSTSVNIDNGVVDVQMDFDTANGSDGMISGAWDAAWKKLGHLWKYDFVMFILPPGADFQAFSYGGSGYSFYSNEWSSSVPTQMEEIGFNLGLGMSLGSNWYERDETGFMGSIQTLDDQRMCYNPQKNYQLGWYSDKTRSIDPLHGDNRPFDFVLNGVNDYERRSDSSIVVRLEQSSKVQDYYIGFNRAKGMNAGTREDRNMVTILRKELGSGANEYGKSYKVASLNPGQEHVIENFNDEEGTDVTVRFVELAKNRDATIQVTSNKMAGGCADEIMDKFNWKPNGRKKTCAGWSKPNNAGRNKCNKTIRAPGEYHGRKVQDVCRKSCGVCRWVAC